MTITEAGRLAKLSGMKYRNGYFSPDYWEKITGINPSEYPEYIKVNNNNLCIWTEKAEKIMKALSNTVNDNFVSIGAKTN